MKNLHPLRKKIYAGAGFTTVFMGSGRKEFDPTKPQRTFDAYLKETAEGTLACGIAPELIEMGVIGSFMSARFLNQANLPGFLPFMVPSLRYRPCYAVEGACGTGGRAIGLGALGILADQADVVFVSAFEVQNGVKAVYGADILAGAAYYDKERKEGHAFFFPGIFSERAGAYYSRYVLQTYGETTEDPYLAYILAASYANLGRFDPFFALYLQGYRNDPDHYLADKMIAVLHIKLFERLLPGDRKEEERALVLLYLEKALTKNPSDHMLYKMQLALSSEKDKQVLVDKLLSTMIREKVVYPRADLQFYVRMALAAGDRLLAQRFLDYSRAIFGYSRSLEAAQRNLDGL